MMNREILRLSGRQGSIDVGDAHVEEAAHGGARATRRGRKRAGTARQGEVIV